MMTLRTLPFMCLLMLLSACGQLDSRVYGTWVDPLGNEESVIFRQDGTVSWFGEEGTFEHDSERYCPPGCIWNTSRDVIRITLPSRNVEIPNIEDKDFGRFPDSWWMYPQGHEVGQPILMFREGTFDLPLMPAHFEEVPVLDEFEADFEFPIIAESYRYDDLAWFDSGANWSVSILGDEPGLFQVNLEDSYSVDVEGGSGLWRYDESAEQWHVVPDSNADYSVSGGFIYDTWNNRISSDQASTWQELPALEGNGQRVLVGTTVVAVRDVTPDAMHPQHEPTLCEISTLDTTDQEPTWTLRRSLSFPANGRYLDCTNYLSLYAHPTEGVVGWDWDGGEPYLTELSTDAGTTWRPFEQACDNGEEVVLHGDGFVCTGQNREVLWYDLASDTWTTHDVEFDALIKLGKPTDGFYLRRGNQIIKWQRGGSESVITTVSSSLGYGDIYVFDDQVIVVKFGIWRTYR